MGPEVEDPRAPVDQFDVLHRSLVCLATENYDNPRLARLQSVPDEVATIAKWLTDGALDSRRFTWTHPQLANDPTKTQVRGALEDPPDTTGWRNGDAAVVYVTGHGIRKDGKHWLCLSGTDPDRPKSTALRTADLVGWLAETEVEHLMVLIDVCHAGGAAGEVADFDVDLPRSWIALGSVTASQTAKVEGLTGAIAGFLEELRTTPQGAKYDHGPYLKVGDFLSALQERLPGQRLAVLSPGLPDLVWLQPVPAEPPVDADPGSPGSTGAAGRRAAPRGPGLPLGPPITGRDLGHRPGLAVHRAHHPDAHPHRRRHRRPRNPGGGRRGGQRQVRRPGPPGHPGRPRVPRHPRRLADLIPTDVLPPVDCVQAAVHAKGLPPDRVLGELCTLLDVPAPASRGIPSRLELLASWSSWLADRPALVTIVIDALDESTNPSDLVDGILARLHDGPGGTNLRLIVGVRSRSHDRPQDGEDPHRAAAADRAAALAAATRINVDDEPWWQPQDLTEYAVSVLTFPPDSPYRTDPGPDIPTTDVATLIADRARRSFLVTRLAAANLADRPQRVDPADPSWLGAIDDGVVGVFRADLHQQLDSPEQVLRALHLMRALAFSYGRGLPWNRIWPAVANAVADDPDFYPPDQSPPSYGDTDIAWLMDTRLVGYLVTDREDNTTVYRLFHDSLTNVLRDQWTELLQPQAPRP